MRGITEKPASISAVYSSTELGNLEFDDMMCCRKLSQKQGRKVDENAIGLLT